MNENQRQQQRQQQKREQDRQKDEVLSGIIDTEKRSYTFKKVYEFFGKKLQGTFEAKYMSISDRLRIGVIRSKLLDGAPAQTLDSLADDIAYMIAYLQVALVKAPKWWNYDQMSLEDDLSKLREVYTEVYTFNKSFRDYYEANSYAGDSSDTVGQETLED